MSNLNQEKTKEILLELGSLYEKHDLTFDEVFQVLELAKSEAEHYLRRQTLNLKFKLGRTPEGNS